MEDLFGVTVWSSSKTPGKIEIEFIEKNQVGENSEKKGSCVVREISGGRI